MSRLLTPILPAVLLYAVALPCTARERPPMRNGINLLDLVEWPEVRAELKTTEEQNARLHEIFTDILGRRAERSKTPADHAEDESSRRQKWREESAALKQEIFTRLDDVLDEKQFQRLRELYAQRYSALMLLNDDELAEKFALTDDQRRQLRRLKSKAGWVNPHRPATTRAESMRENEEKATALLSEDQKEVLAELRGAEFQFAAIRSE